MTDQLTGAAGRWRDWLRRWDRQQQIYIEERERCFDVLLEFAEILLPPEFAALDVAAGPGAVSGRLLARFPRARCVAVDADPVLLEVGRRALAAMDGRLQWRRADLRDPRWPAGLATDSFDLIVSSTATHWLRPADLAALYAELGRLLRPGGVLLNADRLEHPRDLTRIRGACAAADQRRQARALDAGAEPWDDWWRDLAAQESVGAAFAEREREFPTQTLPADHTTATLAFHQAALHEAGFGESAVVWQDLDHRLLLALR